MSAQRLNVHRYEVARAALIRAAEDLAAVVADLDAHDALSINHGLPDLEDCETVREKCQRTAREMVYARLRTLRRPRREEDDS